MADLVSSKPMIKFMSKDTETDWFKPFYNRSSWTKPSLPGVKNLKLFLLRHAAHLHLRHVITILAFSDTSVHSHIRVHLRINSKVEV